jgi:hypothetical protein
MSERIDHADKAARLDASAWKTSASDPTVLINTSERRFEILASAQVHASLALAAEQRTANLIAMAIHNDRALADMSYLEDGTEHQGATLSEHRVKLLARFAEIRERMGTE